MDEEMILGALVVFLLVVALFMCWLYAHARWRLAEDARINAFAEDDQQQIAMKGAQRKGLDKAMIEALPTFIYKSNEDNESLENLQGSSAAAADKGEACSSAKLHMECPVCLCEFQHMERGRVLPNCKHRFHVDCIDTWLSTNATCPVCRASCGAGGDAEVALQVINDHASIISDNMGIQYPTNVLFWGSNSHISSRVSLNGLQQAPASSSIIQVYTQELPGLDAVPAPSSSSTIYTLSPLRRLLSRERRLPASAIVSPHSHIVFHSPASAHISIPKA